ncbi:MAG: BatA domain-containing protein [Aureliella sp.]
MQFLFQPLTWGFLLIGVPILIHLINMLRHRRVEWAAMDFLLESHRKNKRWVTFKQWLLLASRMLAMLLMVMMLAKWVSASEWLNWFGGSTTHHYVLLDDSYSMGESLDDGTAYNNALQALNGLIQSIGKRQGQHQLTLVRWSRATLALAESEDQSRLDTAADLLGVSVNSSSKQLLDRTNASTPTPLALTATPALQLISASISEANNQTSEVYLLSDFRRNEFAEADEIRNQLLPISQNNAEVHLVDCSSDASDNLSLVSLTPEQEVWAAGVPLLVRFQIRNRTNQPAKNVIVRLQAVTYPQRGGEPRVDQDFSGDSLDLPSVVIEQIAPGETVTRQTQVIFGIPGSHIVQAKLDDDSLSEDNARWCRIEIKDSQQVLVIDGEVDQSNAFFFENVIRPSPSLTTGLNIDQQDAAFLRDVAPEALSDYESIILLDVPRLDPQAVAKVEDFCKAGGGVMFVCGRNSNFKFINESLFRGGQGLFPGEVVEIQENLASSGDVPQFSAEPHPIMEPLLGLQASPFSLIQIRQLLNLKLNEEQPLQTIARGPDQRPLLLEKTFGEGRVLTWLTGLTPDWSTFAQDPTFVVVTLRSLGYLGSFRRSPTSGLVGTRIEMSQAGEPVLPEGDILLPARGGGVRVRLKRPVEISNDGNVAKMGIRIDLQGEDRDLIGNLLRPGIFETWMSNAQGERIVKTYARNVAAAEGDLQTVSESDLRSELKGIDFEYRTATAVSNLGASSQDSTRSTFLVVLLALILLGEQALAYSTSYHAPSLGARA